MNTIASTTIWSNFDDPNRLDPESPLARDVLGIDPGPHRRGWTLDNHYINRIPPIRKLNAIERAHLLATRGVRA